MIMAGDGTELMWLREERDRKVRDERDRKMRDERGTESKRVVIYDNIPAMGIGVSKTVSGACVLCDKAF